MNYYIKAKSASDGILEMGKGHAPPFFTLHIQTCRLTYVPLCGVGGEVYVILRGSQQVQGLPQLRLVRDLKQRTPGVGCGR